jgi:magnesium chelatase family protein
MEICYQELRQDSGGESSEQIRERVMKARQRQLRRFSGEKIYSNAQMSSRQIRKYCNISADCERLLESAMMRLGLSARAHDRIWMDHAHGRRYDSTGHS